VGLGAEGLVDEACDDTNFCSTAGIAAEVIGTAEVVGTPLCMLNTCAFETNLLLGGGTVVIIDTVVEGKELPTSVCEAVEIGVELDKGCLSRVGGVLAVAATNDNREVLLLLSDNGAFCIPMPSGVTTDCGFDNAGGGGLLAASKFGRLPPLENGGKDVRGKVLLSKEKLLP